MYFDNNPFALPVVNTGIRRGGGGGGSSGRGNNRDYNTNPFSAGIDSNSTNPFENDDIMFGKSGMTAEDLLATNPFASDDNDLTFADDYTTTSSPSSKGKGARGPLSPSSSSSSQQQQQQQQQRAQYASSGSGGGGGGSGGVVLTASGRKRQGKLKEQTKALAPIFSLERVDFEPDSKIVDMAVCNDVAVMGLKNNHIIRIDLNNPSALEDIEVYKRGETHNATIRRIFLDPTATHLLIHMSSAETYYYHSASGKRPRQLPKLHGLQITSVAWDLQRRFPEALASTGNILVGTLRGDIYEASFDQSGNKDHLWNKLLWIGNDQAIAGLRVERILSSTGDQRFFVIAATPSRFYQFIGGPTLDKAIAKDRKLSYQDIPSSAKDTHNALGFYGLPEGAAQKFGWITAIGVYFGNLSHGSSEDNSTVNCRILFRENKSSGNNNNGEPLQMRDILMTNFHIIMLYDDRVVATNTLSDKDVFTFQFPRGHRACGLAQDYIKGSLWAFCESDVYEIVVTSEDRDAWRLFMEKKMWADAVEYCKGDPTKLDTVYTRQANALIAEGNYTHAAPLFADTRAPVEEVALRLLSCPMSDVLSKYLSKKILHVPKKAHMQLTVLATWLTETFLHNINTLESEINIKEIQNRQSLCSTTTTTTAAASDSSCSSSFCEDGDDFDFDLNGGDCASLPSASVSPLSQSQSPTPQVSTASANNTEALKVKLEELKDEFHKFLKEYYKWLDPKITYDLFQSEGCAEDMLVYADFIKDYERVIAHHMQHGEYRQAIDRLKDLSSEYASVVYKFSPDLMRACPADTVSMWLKLSYVEPRRLFPALMRCEGGSPEMEAQAVRYLRCCCGVGRNTDTAVHNYLLSLLAQRVERCSNNNNSSTGNSTSTTSSNSSSDAEVVARKEFNEFIETVPAYYDLQYALRLCTKLKEKRGCVTVYSRMELYDEAVDLALDIDLDLAKKVADMAAIEVSSKITNGIGGNEERDDDATVLKRRLWLKIAKHEVQKDAKAGGGKIRDVMELVKSCGQLIRIEDILPFFSDNAEICEFEEEICASLKGYNTDIEDLRAKMEESTDAASKIRKDAAEIRTRREVVAADSVCSHCRHLALTRQFYLFPCGHILHMDCILDMFATLMTSTERYSRLLSLYGQFKAALKAEAAAHAGGGDSDGSMMNTTTTAYQQQQQSQGGRKQQVSSQVLKRQLDMVLGFDCPICGNMAIDQITKPFVLPDDPEITQWEIPDN